MQFWISGPVEQGTYEVTKVRLLDSCQEAKNSSEHLMVSTNKIALYCASFQLLNIYVEIFIKKKTSTVYLSLIFLWMFEFGTLPMKNITLQGL
jgi:hypothetical protein